MIRTKKILIKGFVQGVGMRYFISHTAESNHITGTVQNLYNGDVECIAQGTIDNLKQFVEDIKLGHPGTIDSLSVEEINTDTCYDQFEVKLF